MRPWAGAAGLTAFIGAPFEIGLRVGMRVWPMNRPLNERMERASVAIGRPARDNSRSIESGAWTVGGEWERNDDQRLSADL